MESRGLLSLYMAFLVMECGLAAKMYSLKLVHRFSDEVKAVRVSRDGQVAAGDWPEWRSLEYYRKLLRSDLQRQKMRLGPPYEFLFPSEGSKIFGSANELEWLHYAWIDIGMPSVSFFVALDTGSDLLWVPCDCVQCAPLSASYYSSLERDLNEYSPSRSSTSKYLSCSHQLCNLGSTCENANQLCSYSIDYNSDNTSSSGLLVEDILHLASGSADASNNFIRAPVIIGCGRKQSGGYLDGAAPDGLLGLGLGNVSVPSFFSKAGLVANSFSLCFVEAGPGRIFFGDRGLVSQQTTPFLPSDGKYIIGVEICCIGSSCLDQTSFKAHVDSGTSFTFLPSEVYGRVVEEFDKQVNATRSSFDGNPWQYCYKTSSQHMLKTPSVTLKFVLNNSLVIHDPLFKINGDQGIVGFCLAIQPTNEENGTIGQNYMTGYRMVFDRENIKLGWSHSNCQDFSEDERMPMTNASSPNPLPTAEQQSTPGAHAVAPAIAGRTPSKSSAPSIWLTSSWQFLLPLLLLFRSLVCTI